MTTTHRSSAEALLPLVAMLFLFLTEGQTTALPETLQTTSAPPVKNSTLSTHLSNNSLAEFKSRRPCAGDNASFCANGGQCIYPQDSSTPSCICMTPYSGPRCMIITDLSHSFTDSEQMIGIIIGVTMMLFVLAIIMYCCFHKRCFNSAPLKKSAPETPV